MSFQISYDTETDYDYVFVEATRWAPRDWTTLPAKLDDGTDATSTSTGFSCERGTPNGSDWQSLHPFLAHYQTVAADGTCTPTGSSGSWNGATGNSGGWQHWTVDLSAFAGKNVELSITYASDPAVQGLGVFVDDAKITADGATVSETSFEGDEGGWTMPDPPEGTEAKANTWKRSPKAFDEGPGHQDRGHPLLRVRLRGHRRSSNAGGRDEALAGVPGRRLARTRHIGTRAAPRARPGRPCHPPVATRFTPRVRDAAHIALDTTLFE